MVVWLALMAYWVLTDVLITIFPPGGRQVTPDGWLTHLLYTLAGLVAIAAMHRTGFPAAWDAHIPASRRLLLPLLIGGIGGFLTIGVDIVGGLLATLQGLTGQSFNVAFPGSLLIYSAAAIHQELKYLLFPVPVLLWLISSVLLRGRAQTPIFWVLAILSSAAEPVLQGASIVSVFNPGVVAMIVAVAFAINVAAAVCFRRYGLLAAILVRLGYYLVWHVLYGNFLI
jgi:hypothetical protein